MQGFNMNWGLLSAVIIFLSGYPYVRAIISGRVSKPVTSTWLLTSIIGMIILITSFQGGSKWENTLLPILAGAINPVVILILSLRYGEYKWGRLDKICACLCCVTIFIWQITNSPTLGLIGAIVVDVFALYPQVVKNWKEPKDEVLLPWAAFSLASALSILAISEWTIGQALFPIYMTLFSVLALTLPIVLHRLKLRTR